MPGMKFERLAHDFIAVLERYGANVLILSEYSARPLRCRVTLESFRADLDVYLWTITSGGKGRGRPSERRIQLTGITQARLRPGVRTLLGGWCDEIGVYAFWDIRRHQYFKAGSPSLQIDLSTLQNAYHSGFAAETRDVREGPEVAIAVQPDYLFWYLNEWERLYECGRDIDRAAELADAGTEEERDFIDSGENDLVRARRHKVVSVIQNLREARFRPAVLRAYGFRCCVTGWALRLVDAAHIIPVSDPQSRDEVWNGLALCANAHRAYDNGLLGVLPGGGLALNSRVTQKLTDEHLGDGLEAFASGVPRRIRFPGSPDLAPRDDALRRGLILRGWTTAEIDSALTG